jgi:eukaryotic translation initiation factor 2C
MYPLEFCVVPEGQIARRQVPPDVTRQMVEFSAVRPGDRFRDIERGVGVCRFLVTQLAC